MTSCGHGAFMSIGATVVVMGWNQFGLSPWFGEAIAFRTRRSRAERRTATA
jgi:hypothetical protein